ncbi:MAG: O-antigen ligase family protein [Candidatus Omnitrophica bacterium]|nr:O-antigen ligase family protein [Candidatus Omnitrophota bacterium]
MPVVFFVLIFVCALAVMLVNFSAITVGLACITLLLPVVIRKPHLFFYAFVLTRPMLDIFVQQRSGGINLAAYATLALLAVCSRVFFSAPTRRRIRESPLLLRFNVLFGVFLLLSLVSVTRTQSISVSAADFMRLVSLGMCFNYCALYFSERREALTLLIVMLLSSLAPLGLGLWQFFAGTGMYDGGFNRIQAAFIHPAVFSQFLAVIFLIGMYLLVSYRPVRWPRYLLILLMAGVFVELMMTSARTAWIALLAAVLLFAIVRTRLSGKVRNLAVVLLIILVIMPAVQARFSDLQGRRESSWKWRLRQWERNAHSITESPVIGQGLGMYEQRFRFMAHNDYLRIAFETGYAGLSAYCGVMFMLFAWSLRRALTCKPESEAARYKIAVSLMTFLLITSIADNLVRSTVIILYIFMALGTLLGRDTA